MYQNLIKPYPGESKVSFVKREAYYYRILKSCLAYGEHELEIKSNHLKPISGQDKKEIDDLWANYLIPTQRDQLINYRFYDAYKAVLRPGEQLWHYMPDSFYYAFIDEYYNNPQHSRSCDDKNLYDLYFHDIPRARTVFRKLRDIFLDENYNEITIERAIELAKSHEEVILKECVFSSGGEGIMFWQPSVDSEAELKDYLEKSSNNVCQEVIKQHSELRRLNPTSVNTIRIVTFVFSAEVYVLSCVLRMGVNNARVDNASSGGIFCGIKPDGQLKNIAHRLNGEVFLNHPRGVAFDSVIIPGFKDCVDMARSLAKRFMGKARLISWDFAIEESGQPLFIEMNFAGGLDSQQLCNGPIFGDMTRDVLDDVFKNSYTLNCILKSMS